MKKQIKDLLEAGAVAVLLLSYQVFTPVFTLQARIYLIKHVDLQLDVAFACMSTKSTLDEAPHQNLTFLAHKISRGPPENML